MFNVKSAEDGIKGWGSFQQVTPLTLQSRFWDDPDTMCGKLACYTLKEKSRVEC